MGNTGAGTGVVEGEAVDEVSGGGEEDEKERTIAKAALSIAELGWFPP